jgi:hypothetical protein
METHREPRFHVLDVADLEQEIALPGEAVVFAVGGELEPDILLHPHHAADRIVLDRAARRRISPFSAAAALLRAHRAG